MKLLKSLFISLAILTTFCAHAKNSKRAPTATAAASNGFAIGCVTGSVCQMLDQFHPCAPLITWLVEHNIRRALVADSVEESATKQVIAQDSAWAASWISWGLTLVALKAFRCYVNQQS